MTSPKLGHIIRDLRRTYSEHMYRSTFLVSSTFFTFADGADVIHFIDRGSSIIDNVAK